MKGIRFLYSLGLLFNYINPLYSGQSYKLFYPNFCFYLVVFFKLWLNSELRPNPYLRLKVRNRYWFLFNIVKLLFLYGSLFFLGLYRLISVISILNPPLYFQLGKHLHFISG